MSIIQAQFISQVFNRRISRFNTPAGDLTDGIAR